MMKINVHGCTLGIPLSPFQPAGSSLSFALNMTWYDRSLRLLLLILCTHILWLQSQQDNGAAWAYNQHIGICRGRSHSCTPHTEECVGMPYAACVCVVWWCVCVSGGGVWHAAYSFIDSFRASKQHSPLQLLSRLFTEGFPWGYPALGRCRLLAGGLTAFGGSDSPYM